MNEEISIASTIKPYPGDTYETYAYGPNGEEVGRLIILICHNHPDITTFQVQQLQVKEAFRNQGIAKKMFTDVEKMLDKTDGNYMYVYPNSEPYEGESPTDNAILYTIYKRLGFSLDNPDALRSETNHLMIKKL